VVNGLERGFVRVTLAECFDGAAEGEAAFQQDGDMGGEGFDGGDSVGRDKQGSAARVLLAENGLQVIEQRGVQAVERFIQHQHVRLPAQCQRQAKPLEHALGQLAHRALFDGIQSDPFKLAFEFAGWLMF
jgi:hypothetical protein